MAEILKGAAVAAALCEQLQSRREVLAARGIVPRLAIVRLGQEASSLAYERGAAKRCAALGIALERTALPRDISQAELLEEIARLNGDERIHGILLLRPLPKQVNDALACAALATEKDVDGVTPASMARVYAGRGPGFIPCTAQAVLELLDYYKVPLAGTRAAVLGRSLITGRPLALLLQARNATVTLCHSQTRNLAALCREQELLICAVGRAGLLDERFVRAGQTVVDVGINPLPEGGVTGDVRLEQVEPLVRAVTPVPGGVGTVTTAVLAEHVLQAAENRAGI